MKAFKLFYLLLLSGFFFFNSCYEQSFITLESSSDGILHPVEIAIPVTVIKNENSTKNTCTGSIALNIENALFHELTGYLMDVRNFQVKWVTIQVTGDAEGEIENLQLTVGTDNFTIPRFLLGNTYDGNDRKLIDLLQSVFDKVLPPVSATLQLEISGETNVDTDTPLDYILTIDYSITIPAPLY